MNKPELPSMVSTQAEIEAVSGDASKPSEIAALVVRDVCESDPADPNKPETLCVNVNALAAMIVNRLSDHLASQASLAKRGTEPSDKDTRWAWAKYAKQKHSWLNSSMPPMRDGRFDCAAHESEYQDFLAGVRHGRS